MFCAGAAFMLALALPARAQLPAGFTAKDIGAPDPAGSTTVDAKGVFTMKAGGHDIWDSADDFQFVYQSVKGDGSVVARILSQTGGNAEWVKTGPMIRENDTPGARNVMLEMTSGHGVVWQWRDTADDASNFPGFGDMAPRKFPTFMRVQRLGNDFTGFVSNDGKLWKPVFSPHRLPIGDTALFGIAATSHEDGNPATASFDNVAVQPGLVSTAALSGCVGDKAVLLTWNTVPNAVGYNVYRGAADATADKLTKVNTGPVTNASFTDNSQDLVNGTPATYAVAPVFKGADGKPVEGLLVATQAAPVAVPQGLVGCSIGAKSGSVSFDAATGTFTLRSSSGDIWAQADSFYFVSQPMDGDVQVTAKALTQPTHTHDWAKSGVMIRESLEPGARNMIVGVAAANGLWFQWRPTTDAASEFPGSPTIENDSLKLPITVRLTRKGNIITAEYSVDDGKTFKSAGDPFTFDPPLAKTLYVGLGLSSLDTSKTSEVKYSNLEIKKL